jgi:hypothetical protein
MVLVYVLGEIPGYQENLTASRCQIKDVAATAGWQTTYSLMVHGMGNVWVSSSMKMML